MAQADLLAERQQLLAALAAAEARLSERATAMRGRIEAEMTTFMTRFGDRLPVDSGLRAEVFDLMSQLKTNHIGGAELEPAAARILEQQFTALVRAIPLRSS